MQLAAVVGFALAAALLIAVLKQFRTEYALAVMLLAGTMLLLAAAKALQPVLSMIESLSKAAGISNRYVAAALKTIGLCWIASLGADLCRDAGQTSLGAKVELAGRLAVLVALMPLYEDLFELAKAMIGQSG